MSYELYIFGGSIGEKSSRKGNTKRISGIGTGRLSGTYSSKKEAQDAGRRYVSSFHGGRKNYYHPRYRVIKV